jgi:hypothetical protein
MVSVQSSKEEKQLPWKKVKYYIGEIDDHIEELNITKKKLR